MDKLQDGITIDAKTRISLVVSSMFFSLGVTTIFVLLGVGATSVGRLFAEWQQELRYVAAVILALFGLHFLGLLKIPLLYRAARITQTGPTTNLVGAYLMGLAFGFGWTPCVGPALTAILLVAGGMGDPWRGGTLLLIYGLSMTAPFVVAAIFLQPFLGWVKRHRSTLMYAEKAIGLMMIVFAILIASNSINVIGNWMLKTFPVFMEIG